MRESHCHFATASVYETAGGELWNLRITMGCETWTKWFALRKHDMKYRWAMTRRELVSWLAKTPEAADAVS